MQCLPIPIKMKGLSKLFSFKRESVDDYQGVLVPLAQASRHNATSLSATGKQSTKPIIKSSIPDPEKADSSRLSLQSSENSDLRSIEALRAEVMVEVDLSECSRSYQTIQDVGMGRYNWGMFILCGFGWFSDNLWIQQVAITLPSLSAEFGISETRIRYTTCYVFVGLCLGSAFWGVGSDIMGRKLGFSMTLMIAGIFGLAAGVAPSWASVCVLYLLMAFGVGGNLPVDGALFLEFLPNASSSLLTLLSIWWPVGQLVASLDGWYFLGNNYPVDKGWRYSFFTMGSLTFTMFLIRTFFFHLYESPKFLLSRGRQAEAVAVVHGLAYRNRTTTWLTEDILDKIGGYPDVNPIQKLTAKKIIQRKIFSFSKERVGPLFETRKIGSNTALLWFCWMAIGMGYPLFNCFLPQYLSSGQTSSGGEISSYEVYRNYAITSAVGVPGSILAYYAVDFPFLGRKGTMAISTLIAGILPFLFTTSRAASSQLGFSAVQAFFQNIMYGVLYAYTPEVFPAPCRGTGTGISSLLNRIGGLCAPLIAANIPVKHPNTPILASGSLYLAAFIAMLFLSIETRVKQIL